MKKHFQFINHGSIVQIVCLTDEARTWLDEHCESEPWQWMGNTLCVDQRMFAPLHERVQTEFDSQVES